MPRYDVRRQLILTIGSQRQSAAFTRFVDRRRFRVDHVVEEGDPGRARPGDEVLRECRACLERAGGGGLAAVVGFGRSTVLGGVEAIGATLDALAEAGGDRLVTIGPTGAAAGVLSDKWRTVLLLRRLGIAHPPSELVTGPTLPAAVAWPIVGKPRGLTGGAGVAVIPGPAELARYQRRLARAGQPSFVASGFAPGIEASVKLLRLGVHDVVLPVTVKGPTEVPVRHGDDKVKVSGAFAPTSTMVRDVQRLADALGTQGLLSVEGIVDPDRPERWVVTEAAPRCTGSLVPSAAAADRLDPFELFAAYAQDRDVASHRAQPARLAVEVPFYGDAARCARWSEQLDGRPGVLRAVVDHLGELPLAGRGGARLRVTLVGEARDAVVELVSTVERIVADPAADAVGRVVRQLDRCAALAGAGARS